MIPVWNAVEGIDERLPVWPGSPSSEQRLIARSGNGGSGAAGVSAVKAGVSAPNVSLGIGIGGAAGVDANGSKDGGSGIDGKG